MTTIAFDGKRFAADRLNTVSGVRWTERRKLRQLADGRWFAGAGEVQHIEAAFQWLNNGAIRADRPDIPDEGVNAIVVSQDGCTAWALDHACCLYEVSAPISIGSGWQLAAMAMRCGKKADDAIRLAAEFDGGTGSEVDVEIFRKPRKS